MIEHITTGEEMCQCLDVSLTNITQNGLYENVAHANTSLQVAEIVHRYMRTDITELVDSELVDIRDPNCRSVEYKVKYDEPDCKKSPTCDEVKFGCEQGAPQHVKQLKDTLTVTKCVADETSIAAGAFCLDQVNVSEQAFKLLRRMFMRMYVSYNKELTKCLIMKPGACFGGTDSTKIDPQDMPLFKPGDNQCLLPQPQGMAFVKSEYAKMGVVDLSQVITLSGSDYFNHLSMVAPLYQGNTDGLDMSKMTGLGPIYYDMVVAECLKEMGCPTGGNGAITFPIGAIHLLEHFHFSSEYIRVTPGDQNIYGVTSEVRADGNLFRGVVDVSGFLGLEPGRFVVDLEIVYSQCDIGGQLTFRAKKLFDLWCPPQDVWCDDQFWNYILMHNLTCRPILCPEIGDK